MGASESASEPAEAQVPVIDISPFSDPTAHDDAARAKCAGEWDDAMTGVGFCLIVGHGVTTNCIESLRAAFKAYFEGCDLDYKKQFVYGPYGNPDGGYTAMGNESVARSQDEHGGLGSEEAKVAVSDPVESYICSAGDPNDWGGARPKQPDEFKAPAAAYYTEMRRILACLNAMSALALGLPVEYFDPFYKEPWCYVVAKYYPPSSNRALAASPRTGAGLRYGAHTDYTGFTILKPDDADASPGAGGLQVQLKSGKWHSLAPRADAFIVNAGDLYEDWTNGRWMSTVHRVLAPEPGSLAASSSRLSIPFFSGPALDAVITTIETCASDGNPPKLKEPISAYDRDHAADQTPGGIQPRLPALCCRLRGLTCPLFELPCWKT